MDCTAVLEQDLGDQQAAMAMRRILLAAHNRHPTLLSTAPQPLYSGLEPPAACNSAIQNVAGRVVALRVIRTAAKLSP
jgi:hypothetical protein